MPWVAGAGSLGWDRASFARMVDRILSQLSMSVRPQEAWQDAAEGIRGRDSLSADVVFMMDREGVVILETSASLGLAFKRDIISSSVEAYSKRAIKTLLGAAGEAPIYTRESWVASGFPSSLRESSFEDSPYPAGQAGLFTLDWDAALPPIPFDNVHAVRVQIVWPQDPPYPPPDLTLEVD